MIATSPSAGGTVGATTVSDTAALSGGASPTGTIEFELFGPSATAGCPGTAVFDKTVTVSGDASYTSPPVAPTLAGTYWWTASYSGDTANNPTATKCGDESVTVSQASPAIATAPSAGGTIGAAVTDTATLAGGDNPAGTIEFQLYGPSTTANCTGAPVLDKTVTVSGDGSYTSPSSTPSQAGTYWWTASYSGDANNIAVTSGCDQELVTVSQASPGITTVSAATGTGTVGGTTVTDTAVLAGGENPSGTIEFQLFGPSATASCSATAVFDRTVSVSGDGGYISPSFTPSKSGTYWWIASYGGDSNNNSAATTCGDESVTINQASPAITTTASAGGTAGVTTVTDTATLSKGVNPTGTITFNLYGPSTTANCTGTPVDTETASISGNGSYTTPAGFTPSNAGAYWWTASYSGDANNNLAATNCGDESVTITPVLASPTLTTSPSAGGPVGSTTAADHATLAGGSSPTGTVTFNLYGPSETPTCSTTPLDTETTSVTGDGTYTTPTGFTPVRPGTYWWTASYSGDSNNNATASDCGDEAVAILQASLAIATTPSAGGQAGATTATDTAVLSDGFNPGGTLNFSLYGPSSTASCTTTPVDNETVSVNGNGTYTTPSGFTPFEVGTYWWTVSYSGDTNNNPAATNCGDEKVIIGQAAPVITTSQTGGGPVGDTTTDQATLSGSANPTGTITFNLYGPSETPDCTTAPLDAETVSVTGNAGYSTPAGFTPPQAGTYWWTASYSGDTNNIPAATNCGDEPVIIGPGIYWTSSGRILEANLDGSAAHPILSGLIGPFGVAVNGNNLYWTGDDAIWEANLDGSNAHSIGESNTPAGVAVSADHIYWVNQVDSLGLLATGTIFNANLDGSNQGVIAGGLLDPVAVAVNGSNVYWTDDSGSIMEANLNGTNAHTIVNLQGARSGVAVNGSNLYWANPTAGTIVEANLDGTNPQAIITSQNGPSGVAVDSSNLYWTANDEIWEANLDGSNPHAIVTGQTGLSFLAVTPQ